MNRLIRRTINNVMSTFYKIINGKHLNNKIPNRTWFLNGSSDIFFNEYMSS